MYLFMNACMTVSILFDFFFYHEPISDSYSGVYTAFTHYTKDLTVYIYVTRSHEMSLIDVIAI